MSYYWCTDHSRVETDNDKCPANRVLGPYDTSREAVTAVDRIKQREARKQAEDGAWSGDD